MSTCDHFYQARPSVGGCRECCVVVQDLWRWAAAAGRPWLLRCEHGKFTGSALAPAYGRALRSVIWYQPHGIDRPRVPCFDLKVGRSLERHARAFNTVHHVCDRRCTSTIHICAYYTSVRRPQACSALPCSRFTMAGQSERPDQYNGRIKYESCR